MADRTGDLQIAHISKRFGSTQALDDVSLGIAAGEFVSLLGPSGCGKTTLLRCIAGLVEADDGAIHVAGQPLAGTPPWQRDIGVVFQNYALFPHMAVAENVAFGLKMRRFSRAETAAKVERALALVRMEASARVTPAQLSGGQQQRVALARAIAIEPRVLLLDEPMAALDAKLRGAMQLEVRDLQSRLKITTVLVTHDQGEAMTMSDRIAIMSNGKIEQVAAPAELYLRPANSFVADFIGNTNRVTGMVVLLEGRKLLRPDGEPEVLLPLPPQAVAGQHVSLMFRPEAVEIVQGPVPAGMTGIAARVQDRIMTGDRIAIFCTAGAVKLYGTVSSQAERLAALPPAGAVVSLAWRDSDAMLFPA